MLYRWVFSSGYLNCTSEYRHKSRHGMPHAMSGITYVTDRPLSAHHGAELLPRASASRGDIQSIRPHLSAQSRLFRRRRPGRCARLSWKTSPLTPTAIDYLAAQKLFSRRFSPLSFDLSFTGEVWAIPEGTDIFHRGAGTRAYRADHPGPDRRNFHHQSNPSANA